MTLFTPKQTDEERREAEAATIEEMLAALDEDEDQS